MTQAETNPYPHSNSNKRYQTYDYYLRRTFGGKVAKLPLNGGFSCPNLDGTCGYGGCIYCSERGSGDFAPEASLSIAEQIARQKELYAKKWDVSRCIAYFQARTNTYAPAEVLRSRFEEALAQEGIVGLNIATRPDCLPREVLSLLAELAERTVLTVELGLQSSNDATARRINRGHTFAQFREGVEALRLASPRIGICAHLILGLPGEGREEMLQTVEDVAALEIPQVKLHLLHVLRGTALAEQYLAGDYLPLEREAYLELLADAIERLPTDTVICRLTGDGKAEDLLAPLWSKRKTTVVNDLDKLLYARGSYQGCRCPR
ncbi:MAG: TIGR01212 family radical SAM protein [Ruminococcaceae bacterium]|nr:TIGR01212 family radical SAM protein [Oscillospiraceae bacterium]